MTTQRGARGQTILTSGASQGTRSGRALDAERGSAASTGIVVLSLVLALLASAPLVCIEIIRLCA